MNKLNKYEELFNKNDYDLTSMDYYINERNDKFNKASFMELKERGRTILITGHDEVQRIRHNKFFIFKKYGV